MDPSPMYSSQAQRMVFLPNSSGLRTHHSHSGIGNALVTELAVHGFNLVIHGRNVEKLAKVQSELQAAHTGVDVITICADASQRIDDWDALLAPLKELHITILINNVGNSQSGSYFPVDRVSDEDIYTLIHTNDIFPTLLTKHMLPKLIANAPSLILNIGSVSGAMGVPLLAVYSGTKAYNLTFSRAVYNDLRLLGHDNVECKAVFVVRPPLCGNEPDWILTRSFVHTGQRIHKPQHRM
jgi:17beta-estradiol 17-dehydrogenase / very-long-chain 3-oxoacyl-CoA reductase